MLRVVPFVGQFWFVGWGEEKHCPPNQLLFPRAIFVSNCECVSVWVCVRVWVSEREREREALSTLGGFLGCFMIKRGEITITIYHWRYTAKRNRKICCCEKIFQKSSEEQKMRNELNPKNQKTIQKLGFFGGGVFFLFSLLRLRLHLLGRLFL